MAITHDEIVIVAGERITAELLVWRRYRQRTVGIVEALLDRNPHLARGPHIQGPFIPPGTRVKIPIDPAALIGRPEAPTRTILLYGEVDQQGKLITR